jgi:hypothetical protein
MLSVHMADKHYSQVNYKLCTIFIVQGAVSNCEKMLIDNILYMSMANNSTFSMSSKQVAGLHVKVDETTVNLQSMQSRNTVKQIK